MMVDSRCSSAPENSSTSPIRKVCREQNQEPRGRRTRYAHRPVAGGVDKISALVNVALADSFALYLKTKNFHWHVSGRHFRDYHLLLDEQGEQIFATTDDLAERVRKIGGTTLRSIGQIAKLQTIEDNDDSYVPPARNAARVDARQQEAGGEPAQGA